MSESPGCIYEFGEFRLHPEERVLEHHGQAIPLTPKLFDTLLMLVQNSGRLLEKEQFMNMIWPGSYVEEGNLSQNVFLLRRILGDDQNGHSFIQTIPRRGYKFVAAVKEVAAGGASTAPIASEQDDYWAHHSPFRGLRVFEQ